MIAAPSISELDAIIDQIGAIEGCERTLSSIILSTRISNKAKTPALLPTPEFSSSEMGQK